MHSNNAIWDTVEAPVSGHPWEAEIVSTTTVDWSWLLQYGGCFIQSL